MARTPQWVLNLAGYAGVMYVTAELSKRNIPASPLPKNFPDDDIMIGKKDSANLGWIQVKACQPPRGETFRIYLEDCQKWAAARQNEYLVFVWLGSPEKNESPTFWVTERFNVGRIGVAYVLKNPENNERRFAPDKESGLNPKWKGLRLKPNWRRNWKLLENYKAYP